MRDLSKYLGAIALLALAGGAMAAGGDLGQVEKQATNWTAIIMFGASLPAPSTSPNGPPPRPSRLLTSTPPAAASPVSRTAWPSPATTASAASFLGISVAVMASEHDYPDLPDRLLGRLAGDHVRWPNVCVTSASSTFADVAAYRSTHPIRALLLPAR